MYKKFMLSLVFLSIFSSNESLCIEPVTTALITYAVVSTVTSAATAVVVNLTNKMIENCDPSKDKQVRDAEARERLHFIDARIKFRKCAEDSKPESEKNIKGVPVKCKDLARTFLACGGKDEMIKIIADLEEYGS